MYDDGFSSHLQLLFNLLRTVIFLFRLASAGWDKKLHVWDVETGQILVWIFIVVNLNLGQYDRPRVLGCEPVDGVLVVLSLNQLNIPTFVHQIGRCVCVCHLVNKSSNIYWIWTKNNQYPIYWFASKYSRSVILAQVWFSQFFLIIINTSVLYVIHCVIIVTPMYCSGQGSMVA